MPGYYLTTIKSGTSKRVVDTCVLTYDIYFVGQKALRGEVVQATLKAIWANRKASAIKSAVQRMDP